MNVIVAVILAAVLLMTVGNAQPVVTGLGANLSAQAAGIMEGDIIREMNGVRIDFTL